MFNMTGDIQWTYLKSLSDYVSKNKHPLCLHVSMCGWRSTNLWKVHIAIQCSVDENAVPTKTVWIPKANLLNYGSA